MDIRPGIQLSPYANRKTLLRTPDKVKDSTLKAAACPTWLLTLPDGVANSIQFDLSREFPLPSTPVILILYAGKDDALSLESALHSLAPWMSSHVLAIDVLRGLDMLTEEPYNSLCMH